MLQFCISTLHIKDIDVFYLWSYFLHLDYYKLYHHCHLHHDYPN